MQLHLAKTARAYQRALALAVPGDTLIWMEEAVYLAVEPEPPLPEACTLYVLEEDLIIRGLQSLVQAPNVMNIRYPGLVNEVKRCQKTLTWF